MGADEPADRHKTGRRLQTSAFADAPPRFWLASKSRLTAEAGGIPDFTKDVESLGSYQPVIALFKKAAQHLQAPKVRFKTPDGTPWQLQAASPASKYPGTIGSASV